MRQSRTRNEHARRTSRVSERSSRSWKCFKSLNQLSAWPASCRCRCFLLADYFYVIDSGKVAIVLQKGNITHQLAVLERGDFFGELALLNHKVRSWLWHQNFSTDAAICLCI
eukprot:SAG11_NODE_2255_length_3620_cov_1.538483_2_plen_112_part_00